MITLTIHTTSTTISTTKLTILTLLGNTPTRIRTIQATMICLRRKELINTLTWDLTKDLMEVEEVFQQFLQDNLLRSLLTIRTTKILE
jgi:uncharacterized membrane protein YjjP (DUF1212 family)